MTYNVGDRVRILDIPTVYSPLRGRSGVVLKVLTRLTNPAVRVRLDGDSVRSELLALEHIKPEYVPVAGLAQ